MAKKSVKKKKPLPKKRTSSASTAGAKRKKPSTPGKSKSAATKKKAATKKVTKPSTSRSPKVSISKIDQEIIRLVNQRAVLSDRQIREQKSPQRALFDPSADDALWQDLAELNKGPLPNSAVRAMFRELLSAVRRQVKTQRVAYLGPRYSYTHLAAIERFGHGADLIPVNTIASVFEEVNRGHAEYGIVPIENSTDGRIVDTLDMFTRLPLRICGEVQISVHHNLLARCPRGEIVEIYSKPQALSQCRDWLSKNMPAARLIEVTSTSTAAQLARDKPGVAAVASRQASVEYGLQIVADDIQDNKNNVTRFAIIGDEQSKATGKDRTAILLQIPHKPGSLSDSLVAFKKNKVNLTWIESFPLRGPETGYLFFLDFEGHSSEAKVRRTLEALERTAVRMEILGSYPRSEPID